MEFLNKVGDAISNVGEALGDIGERALTGVGLKDKDPASVAIEGGELKHNIDLSDFDPNQKAQIEAVLAEQAQSMEDLQAQLKEAKSQGDVAGAKMIEADIAKLDAGLTELKFELEHTDFNFGKFLAGNLILPGFGGLIAQGIGSDADERMVEAFGKINASPVEAKAGAGVASTGGASSGGADGAGGADPLGYTNADYDQMMDKLTRDPAGLMADLEGLSPEDRNMVLTMLQQRLQEVNRMFSMMSNMQKSIHDTQKAMINNFRV